jgi:chromosome segregation ATPase
LQQDLRTSISSRDALTGKLSKANETVAELQENLKLRDDEIAELKIIISELRDREPKLQAATITNKELTAEISEVRKRGQAKLECDQDLLNDRTLLELILIHVDAIKKLRRKES